LATAVACAILQVNPFDRPDVEAAKIKICEMITALEKKGRLSRKAAVISTPGVDLYTDEHNAQALRQGGAKEDLTSWLKAHFDRGGQGRLCRTDGFYRAKRSYE